MSDDKTPLAAGADTLRDGLFRLGRVMEKVDDLDRLLHAVIQECKRLLHCEAASLAIYDAERGDLVFTIAEGGSEQGIIQWRMKMGQGIVGLVAQTREPVMSNDPKSDRRWFGAIDNSSGFVTRNLAAAPMIHSDRLVGVVEALNKAGAGFSDDDLILLQIFADQMALALEINRLIKAREESQRLATFAVALADIGHSTKNLLMRLEFPITMIDKALGMGDAARAKSSWEVMKGATREIGKLVRDMLEYSKPRQPELAEVNVADVARKVVAEAAPDAQSKNIALAVEGAGGDLIWVLDPRVLAPALHNLIGNAIEAMAEHGGTRVVTALQAESKELRIRVTDDGPGIPPELHRRIFDPFFSTKGKKGTGIGLASVKKGVEEHGGRVSLTSEPGKGTSFVLTFPKAELKLERAVEAQTKRT